MNATPVRGKFNSKIRRHKTNDDVIHAKEGDKVVIKSKPNLKNTSSRRLLPLIKDVQAYLEKLHAQQKANQVENSLYYSEEYSDYICVNEIGEMMSPNNVGKQFSMLLKRNNLRHIRFHDLRHSCATLILANGVPLKDVQLWLGHSNIGTTSAFYAHRVFQDKIDSADKIANALHFDFGVDF